MGIRAELRAEGLRGRELREAVKEERRARRNGEEGGCNSGGCGGASQAAPRGGCSGGACNRAAPSNSFSSPMPPQRCLNGSCNR